MSISRHWTTYLFYAYLFILVWLPLPLGSRPAWSIALFNLLTASLSLVALLGVWRKQHPLPAAWALARWPLCAWFAYFAWLLLQGMAGFQINAFRSQQQLLLGLSYLQLFMLTLLLVDTRDRLRTLFYVLLVSGLFQAMYGSVMAMSGIDKIWWIEKTRHLGLATGTFRNRNQLANYLVMSLACGCGLLIAAQASQPVNSLRQFLRRIVEWLLSGSGWLRLLLAALVIGIVLTHSRMGNASLFISLTLVGALWLWRWRRHSGRHRAVLLIGSLLLVDSLIVGAWFGIDKVAERLQQTRASHTAEWVAEEIGIDIPQPSAMDRAEASQGSASTGLNTPTGDSGQSMTARSMTSKPPYKKDINELRDEALPQLIKMAKTYAWTGIGLGNFSTGFTAYSQLQMKYYMNEAHCDYLQFIIEVGMMGTALLVFIVLYCAVAGLQVMWQSRSRLLQGAGFAVLMTMVAGLLHAWVDYNFQVTATAATFVVIMAVALVARSLPDRPGRQVRVNEHESVPYTGETQ